MSGDETVAGPLRTLFVSGTLGGLTDEELLDRFRSRSAAAEPAFTLLVERHGPMVLGVCRGILRDEHDAEDAFQAAFLVLARRASAIRRANSVSSWLFGVARRVALRARARRLRMRHAEAAIPPHPVAVGPTAEPLPELYEELDRLPERFRAVLVLCDLEDWTYERAAGALRCPLGTVQSRLARGRERLRRRLVRRGLAPSIVGARTASASVPAPLREAAIRHAGYGAVGKGTVGVVPAEVAHLVEEVVAAMIRANHVKFATAIAVGACALALALPVVFGSVPGHQGRDESGPSQRATPGPDPARPGDGVTPPAEDQIAPLLGKWRLVLPGGRVEDGMVAIKMIPNGPGLAEALGFEAPFVCTLTKVPPDGSAARPYMLIFVDPGANPHRLTFLLVGRHPGDNSSLEGNPGIYRVEGDTLTIHWTARGERPSDFEREEGTPTILNVYRRVADDPPPRGDQ